MEAANNRRKGNPRRPQTTTRGLDHEHDNDETTTSPSMEKTRGRSACTEEHRRALPRAASSPAITSLAANCQTRRGGRSAATDAGRDSPDDAPRRRQGLIEEGEDLEEGHRWRIPVGLREPRQNPSFVGGAVYFFLKVKRLKV
jgi:hypothetical protein